ncbi:hypothetical protein LTR20_008769 [Exophiala xenobiotica]|nr:hypothetical protein LTS13_008660 [Exophiala xenobiotica]KAK5392517.1 hypothetical protein LTR79_009983 [Exophiala xenobiotica]KAK5424337.1 hypothetical protein LTR90_001683 [Exophiala xenobiotica]KAK5457418.1 hypothetical protein LTR20_008769 [Exophiala xenobiotica]KAK5474617.1 hypothetical protein LTR26_009816 [Exophiala xenobiotica]
MGKTFRSVIIASTGDFGDKTDKIKNWVEHAGGTFSKDINPSVTHLVASKKAWKRYHPMVQAARRLKTIHIVKIDWLEDSLTMSKSRKPLDEAKYAYEQRNIKTKKASRTRKRNGYDKSRPNHDEQGMDDPKDEDGQKGEGGGTQSNTVADNHVEVGVHSTPRRDPETAKKKKQQQQQEQKHDATVVKKKQQQQQRLGRADQELHCSKDEQIEISAKEYDAECAEFERELGQHGYRPFIDANGFTFLVTLVREDILQNRLEKHRLKVRYASCFSSLSSATSYPITNQEPDHRRRPSDDDESLHDLSLSLSLASKSQSQSQSSDERHSDESLIDTSLASQFFDRRRVSDESIHDTSLVSQSSDERNSSYSFRIPRAYAPTWSMATSRPSLPHCPVTMYRFPKPYPYSRYPVIASSLPRSLSLSNPALRVHIPNPWTQSLQLFEHDPMANATAANANANEKEPKAKSYACYSIYIRPGHRYVTQLAPPGSTFDFAFTMFNKFFHKRVGVSWDDREQVKKVDESAARDEDEWDLRGDGAGDDRFFRFFGPKIIKQQPGIGDGTGSEVEIDSVEGRQRKPSVTVLMNPRKDAPRDEMDLVAKTPDGRW